MVCSLRLLIHCCPGANSRFVRSIVSGHGGSRSARVLASGHHPLTPAPFRTPPDSSVPRTAVNVIAQRVANAILLPPVFRDFPIWNAHVGQRTRVED